MPNKLNLYVYKCGFKNCHAEFICEMHLEWHCRMKHNKCCKEFILSNPICDNNIEPSGSLTATYVQLEMVTWIHHPVQKKEIIGNQNFNEIKVEELEQLPECTKFYSLDTPSCSSNTVVRPGFDYRMDQCNPNVDEYNNLQLLENMKCESWASNNGIGDCFNSTDEQLKKKNGHRVTGNHDYISFRLNNNSQIKGKEKVICELNSNKNEVNEKPKKKKKKKGHPKRGEPGYEEFRRKNNLHVKLCRKKKAKKTNSVADSLKAEIERLTKENQTLVNCVTELEERMQNIQAYP